MTQHRRRTSVRAAHRDVPRPKPHHFATYAEAEAVIKAEDLHVTEILRCNGGMRINVVETDKRAKARTLYVKPLVGEATA